MTTSRRKLLLTGAASGVAAVTMVAGPAAAAPVDAGFTPAPDLGVTPGGDATTNRRNLIAALSGSSTCVLFPPGDYRLDNSGNTLMVSDFSGRLVMQPGARVLLTDNAARGLIFRGGVGARFSGVTITYVTRPTSRVEKPEPADCLLFLTTTDTYLEHTRIIGSAAAGLLFWQCTRPMVFDAFITDTMADGLHFANCHDGWADHVTTVDTGDDGVAFINYAAQPDATGGLATNLSVTRSKARGVCVGGQSGVTIRDVSIKDTVSPGILCEGHGGWNVRVPTGVTFERVRIVRGGAWLAGGADGKVVGARVATATAVLREVTIEDSLAHGLHCESSTVTVLDVTVKRVTGSPGSGLVLNTGSYIVDRATVEEVTGIGLSANDCARLEYGTVTLRATARTHPTRRAVSIENTAFVFGERIWVEDTGPRVIGTYEPKRRQRGSLGTIVDVNRDVVVLDNVSKLSVVEVDPA